MTRSQIEQIAERVAEQAPDRTDTAWLKKLVVRNGGEIRPTPDCQILLVAVASDNFVVSAEGPWQLAEALGHVSLHLPHAEPHPTRVGIAVPARVAASGTFARARAEAGWFASALLMPSGMFRASWERNAGHLRTVAIEFRVPMASAAARALRLGLR